MPHTSSETGDCGLECGADPLVRSGPPGPACSLMISLIGTTNGPTWASAADQGVRPTAKSMWHKAIRRLVQRFGLLVKIHFPRERHRPQTVFDETRTRNCRCGSDRETGDGSGDGRRDSPDPGGSPRW